MEVTNRKKGPALAKMLVGNARVRLLGAGSASKGVRQGPESAVT
jgi:hypothetical protein